MNIANATDRKIPERVIRKAQQVLERLEQNQAKAHPLKYARKGYTWKIEIGWSWRCVSSDRHSWLIMSHETYSKQLLK